MLVSATAWDGWSVTIELQYRLAPDIAGGVLPDDFLGRLEQLMQRQINLRLRMRRSGLCLIVRGAVTDDRTLTLHGILLVPRDAHVPWGDNDMEWGVHRDRVLSRLSGGELLGSSVYVARFDDLTAKADRLVRMLTLLDDLHHSAARAVERVFAHDERKQRQLAPQYYGQEAHAVLQAVRDLIRDAAYHKRSLVHLDGEAWLRRYEDTCRTYVERARALWPDEDNVSASFAAAAMRRPVLHVVAHGLVAAARGIVLRDDRRAIDEARQIWRALEHDWDTPSVDVRDANHGSMYRRARDRWNQRQRV